MAEAIPTSGSVTRSQVIEACEALGVDATNAVRLTVTPYDVFVVEYERCLTGCRILAAPGEGYAKNERRLSVVKDEEGGSL